MRIRIHYLFLAIAVVLLGGIVLRSQTQISVKQIASPYVVTGWARCVDTPADPPVKMTDCTGIVLATIYDVRKQETKKYTLIPASPEIAASPLFVMEVFQ